MFWEKKAPYMWQSESTDPSNWYGGEGWKNPVLHPCGDSFAQHLWGVWWPHTHKIVDGSWRNHLVQLTFYLCVYQPNIFWTWLCVPSLGRADILCIHTWHCLSCGLFYGLGCYYWKVVQAYTVFLISSQIKICLYRSNPPEWKPKRVLWYCTCLGIWLVLSTRFHCRFCVKGFRCLNVAYDLDNLLCLVF